MPANLVFADWLTGDLITATKLNQMKNHDTSLELSGRSSEVGRNITNVLSETLQSIAVNIPAGKKLYLRRVRTGYSGLVGAAGINQVVLVISGSVIHQAAIDAEAVPNVLLYDNSAGASVLAAVISVSIGVTISSLNSWTALGWHLLFTVE
jgi:hypothetical protein